MATKGHGVKIGHAAPGTAVSGTFTDFARVTTIGNIEIEADDIETSNMDSPNQFKEFAAGWADAGEVEITAQFDKSDAADVWALFRQDKTFRIEWRDGSKLKIGGYVKKFGVETDREGLVTVPLTLRISGEPELVPAASA